MSNDNENITENISKPKELKKTIVGYARVSTPKQRLDRQISNLKAAYPDIIIVAEVFTGSTDNRPKWKKLLRQCRAGQVSKLVFDEVSRFSRNAEEAIVEYKELFNLGIELEFLKEPHINSSVYREASQKKIEISTDQMDEETANLMNTVITGLNDYLLAIAEKQIFLAFEHAQRERELLSKRTSEGLRESALLKGEKLGRKEGTKLETKKSKRAKRVIRKLFIPFGGPLTATQCYKVANITKSTFYRYIKQIIEEDAEKGIIWPDDIIKDTKRVKEDDMSDKELAMIIKNFYDNQEDEEE